MTASEGQKQVEPSKQHAGRTTRFRHIERQVSCTTSHELPTHTNCVLIIKRRSDRHAPWISRERNLRSKIRWFTEFCNSHYLSQLATFFIDARAKRSTVRSCHVLYSLCTQDAKQHRIGKCVRNKHNVWLHKWGRSKSFKTSRRYPTCLVQFTVVLSKDKR